MNPIQVNEAAETVTIPIVGKVKDEKVTYYCPKCKSPRKSSRQPVTTICNDCLLGIEMELKEKIKIKK